MEKILIIEDDLVLPTLLTTTFRRKGFDVSIATDGKQGFEYAKNYGPYDLIYTGILMPVLDGITLLKR